MNRNQPYVSDMKEDLAAQAHMTERSMHWHDAVTAYRRAFEDAVLTRDASFSSGQLPRISAVSDLFGSPSMDLTVLKFHLVTVCSSCTDLAVAQGLPRALAHGIKDTFFQALAREQRPEHLAALTDRYIQELIAKLQEHCRRRCSHTVLMATTFIYQNLYRNIHPRDVAVYLKKDRTYLAKRFREETGLTLSAYIRRAKIDRAKQLIAQHLYSLTEISEMLGYSGYAQFYRDFRKETGTAPGEFTF